MAPIKASMTRSAPHILSRARRCTATTTPWSTCTTSRPPTSEERVVLQDACLEPRLEPDADARTDLDQRQQHDSAQHPMRHGHPHPHRQPGLHRHLHARHRHLRARRGLDHQTLLPIYVPEPAKVVESMLHAEAAPTVERPRPTRSAGTITSRTLVESVKSARATN